MFINPENNLGLVLFSSYMILGAFWVGYNVWAGLCHLYSLSVLATVSDAFLSLLRASCVCVYQGLWQWCGGRLFGLDCFWGIFFRCAMVVLPSFHVIFGWGTLSEIVCEIPTFWLSGNRQEKARKWSLIFSKLKFTVWTKCCGYSMFFHFWTTAVKKAGVLNLQLCCLTVFCCEWQSFVFVWQSGGWGTTQIVGCKLL